MASEMRCPVDGTALVMSERQNIEIDYCPSCRGVWLDRGELDKIIERSAPSAPAAAAPSQRGHQPGFGGGYGHGHGYSHKKRPKSFLEELFD
ncbi:MAG TPA: zf-TFIIB domain-containing protein [Allosphingosinicella sp.]|nr:zf-TFIIB domain-containing protein [Allosphingosinicella sp.]